MSHARERLGATQVTCPYCGSAPGVRCISQRDSKPLGTFHRERKREIGDLMRATKELQKGIKQ